MTTTTSSIKSFCSDEKEEITGKKQAVNTKSMRLDANRGTHKKKDSD